MKYLILALLLAGCSNPLGGKSSVDNGYQPGGLGAGTPSPSPTASPTPTPTPAPTPWPAPTVSSVVPAASTFAGGAMVRITGSGFRTGVTAKVGSTLCTTVTLISATAVDCVVPAAAAISTVSVSAENTDAQSASLASAFTYIGSPKVWLDASAVVGLNSGDLMTSWSDSSANANTFSQPSVGSRPTWVENVLNGHAVARFNGSMMTSGSPIGISGADPRTAFIVSKKVSIGYRNIFGWGGAGTNLVYDFMNYSSGMMVHFYSNDSSSVSLPFTPGVWSVLGNIYSGSTIRTSTDGVNSSPLSIAINTTNSVASIGGGAYATYNGYDGDIAEAIILPQAVTPAEQSTVTCYLSRKYALALAGCP